LGGVRAEGENLKGGNEMMGGLEILSLGVDGGFGCLNGGEVREGGFIFEIEGLDGLFSC